MKPKHYPIVGIPCDVIRNGLHPFHGVGEKYINAISAGAQACPLLIPASGPGADMPEALAADAYDALLDTLDGIFLPGSPSNLQPQLYSAEASLTPESHDPQRDALSLPLIRAAMERGLPILAVCRGMQELNVALGGTLHQKVHQVPGMMDHREDKQQNREGQYGKAHEVTLTPGGLFEQLAGAPSIQVNSLHGQGMKDLAKGLVVEAKAADGLVEGFRWSDPKQFLVAVQWHPEWRFHEDRFSTALFQHFGEVLRA